MVTCPVCGSSQRDGVAFCSDCGSNMKTISPRVQVVGTKGVYLIVPDTPPLGEGRDSLVLRALDQAGNDVCIKLYNSYVKTTPKWQEFYQEIIISKVLT